MRIAVFGAAGWLGRAILSNLVKQHEVEAFDRDSDAWHAWQDIDGDWGGGRIIHGDISDGTMVDSAVKGMDAVVHAAVYFPEPDETGNAAFRFNVQGLWNVLESARRYNVKRIVHIGSCHTEHPDGTFFTADVRRPDTGLYGVTKRLQEELCRTYHETVRMKIVVLRADYIVDSLLGIGRYRERLGHEHGNPTRNGWVCRHDLAEACRLAIEASHIDFDIFHIVGTPEAYAHCNVARSREVLGLVYAGNLEQYR